MPVASPTVPEIRLSNDAPAPRPKKLIICSRKVARSRRRFSDGRLRRAERLLGELILGADHVGEGIAEIRGAWPVKSHFLLISLDDIDFNTLCSFGAELEDLEANGDDEPDDNREPDERRLPKVKERAL